MARKRMFDGDITESDLFAELPNTSKAIYFLLGMAADDEGFVSSKRVLRVHGGTKDDILILIAKGFLITFKEGLVVIVHWHMNNWLDKRRTKPTIYTEQRKHLARTPENIYVYSEEPIETLPEADPDFLGKKPYFMGYKTNREMTKVYRDGHWVPFDQRYKDRIEWK